MEFLLGSNFPKESHFWAFTWNLKALSTFVVIKQNIITKSKQARTRSNWLNGLRRRGLEIMYIIVIM